MRFSAVQAAAAVALSSLLIPACASAARSVGTPSGAVASDATASRQPPTDAPQSAAAASADAVRVAGAAGVVGAEAGHADTGPLLRKAGELLDTALVQQEDPRLWTEAGASLGSARTALITARQQGARRSLVEPALSTIDALDAWRALQESAAADEATDPALADSRHAWRAAFEQAAVTQLDAARGAWPQTDEALLTVLFEAGRSDEAARELAETLRQDPSRRQVHALVHTWRDAIADPHALLPLLDGVSWSGDATAPDGGASRLATTRGYLRLSLGIAMQATSDADAAAAVFEQGAADFEAARAAPVTDVSDWELLSRRTDCLVNAARLHEGLAEAALPSGAGGVAAAQPELVAAERDYGDALAASPADEDASAGLALTGDAYYRGGSVEGARDFFGRVARRFDVPEWWNNYAFFCRETKQYEESYAAYEKCIALAPDNARWVNDTGLILLYHLNRDLDHAEALFRRAWELGKAVCDNPIASDDARAENLSAYGDALLNLAKLSVQRGDNKQAHVFVDELLKASPERIDAQHLKTDIDKALAAKPG